MAACHHLAVAVACSALLGVPVAAAQQADAAGGVYAGEQAARGERLFGQWCTECHARSDMASENFQLKWAGRTALELYDRISVSMPENFPGAMAPSEYLDVLTYLLKLNGGQAGPAPLAADTASLRRVRIGGPPARQSTPHHVTQRGR